MVSFDFLDRRSAERFAELLDETSGGRHHHARGQADEQLAELVAIGHSLSAARSGVQVDSEFRMGLRAMLVATAERDGIGVSAAATEPEPDAAEPVRKLLGRTGRRIRARGAIVIGVAAGAMAVSGISAASDGAAPGDALYGVKRSTERAQLAMAGSDVTRGQLSLTFARNRLTEAAAMKGDNPKLTAVLDDMDNDTRQGVKLLASASVTRADAVPLASVDAFVDNQRLVLEPRLDRLAPENRKRALASIGLLDLVEDRADDLRAGLECDKVTQTGIDSLGPKLRNCAVGAADTSTPSNQQGQGQDQGQKESPQPSRDQDDGGSEKAEPASSDEPAAEPTRTHSTTSGEDTSQNRVHSTSSDPEPEPVASDEPVAPVAPATEDKGLLGGLLGGIFGK